MGQFGTMLTQIGSFSLTYAGATLKGVSAKDFARMPDGITTNTPAFVFGHLSIYPDRMLEMIGRADLAKPNSKYEELFSAGRECRSDPDGTIYPPMEAIVTRFNERHQALLSALPETPDEVFARPNPLDRMRERFPTIGAVAVFLLASHVMMHLGQVSAWRRCMGLAPCL